MIAANRWRRPGAGAARTEDATPEELESCPFCAGREDRTPPETLRIEYEGEWLVRVVPNLYPAFERQEVVIHSPHHARSLAEIDEGHFEYVAEAWHRRARDTPTRYLHALINEGRGAGASLPHSHSQLVWLDRPPPEVVLERYDPCGVCEILGAELVVASIGTCRAVVHPAGRTPYEMLVAPMEHQDDAFASGDLGLALANVADAVRYLRHVEGPVPVNVWLHDGPHWHLHVVPRLSVFAGIELGAGIYVNTLAPEDAAAALRAAR